MTTRRIEIDSKTVDLLEARARGRGISLSELLADVASNEAGLTAELAEARAEGKGPWSPKVIEEDARRLVEFERSRIGVPWVEVKAWMESWGTPNEGPVPESRKL